MLDDLRDDADFVEEDQLDPEYETETAVRSQTQFLGMTPEQRFVIAVLMLLMICILGAFCLLITGMISLPI